MMGTDEKQGTPQQRAADAEMQLLCLDRQAEKGTYLSKRSYLCGWVDLYAPGDGGDPKAMASQPWLLKVEKDPETGKKTKYRVKPMHALEAFRHNGLLPYRTDWHAPMPKLTPTNGPLPTKPKEETSD